MSQWKSYKSLNVKVSNDPKEPQYPVNEMTTNMTGVMIKVINKVCIDALIILTITHVICSVLIVNLRCGRSLKIFFVQQKSDADV